MKDFNPDDYPNKTCCGLLEYFVDQGYVYPISKPIGVSQELAMSVMGWSIRYCKQKPSGDISTKDSVHLLMNFCPFCGKALTKDD
jgi:hypothetical protein